jgi:hypothetical protein
MGDRCWLQVSCRKSDLKKITEQFGGVSYGLPEDPEDHPFSEIIDDEKTWMTGQIDEINYGGLTDLEELAEAGIPFTGSSGTGGGYGPAVMACDGKTFFHMGASWDGYPFVEIGPNGELIPKGVMQRIREYYLILDRAKRIIEKGEKLDDRPELPEEMKNCAGPCKGPITVADDHNLCHCCGLYFCDICWDKHDECEPCSDCGQMHITTPCPV